MSRASNPVGIIGAPPLGVISTRNWNDLTWSLVRKFDTTGITVVEPMPPYNDPLALGPGGVLLLLDVTVTPLTAALQFVPATDFTPNPLRSFDELNQWMTP